MVGMAPAITGVGDLARSAHTEEVAFIGIGETPKRRDVCDSLAHTGVQHPRGSVTIFYEHANVVVIALSALTFSRTLFDHRAGVVEDKVTGGNVLCGQRILVQHVVRGGGVGSTPPRSEP